MNIIKSTGTFSFYTLLSRISGYFRDILIAIFLGSGPIADALWHTGQIVSFRRSSGNPIPKGVNMLTGERSEQ